MEEKDTGIGMTIESRQGVLSAVPTPKCPATGRHRAARGTLSGMVSGVAVRRFVGATVGVVLASIPIFAAPAPRAAARTPACPLAVQALRRQGTAVQVLMRNQAPYAVDNVVIHVTFTDAARATHQLAFHMNQTVAQHLTTVYTTPPITGSIVVWSTLAVTMECHMVRH
jgi:hypothetical protein